MDDGVTLTFRARIPTPKKTTGPLDTIYRHGGAEKGPKPYPEGGDGTLINDQGFSNVYLSQPRGGGSVGFGLTVPDDNFTGSPEDPTSGFSGLVPAAGLLCFVSDSFIIRLLFCRRVESS